MSLDDITREMAELAGIRLGYRDAFGREVDTPMDSIRDLLRAIGFAADDDDTAQRSLERLRLRRDRALSSLIACESGKSAKVELYGAATSVAWKLAIESGDVTEGHGEYDAGRWTIMLPALDTGYHHLSVHIDGSSFEATVIAAPPRCWRPGEDRPRWGVSGAVYGLRSEVDYGIGDIGSIGGLAEVAGRRGADFLGLSPLHVLFPSDRGRTSPYSPSSRLFIDPIYIDPGQVPGFETMSPPPKPIPRNEAFVDYAAAWAAKRPILEALWRRFAETGGTAAFERFRSVRGHSLERYALFEALAELDNEKRPSVPPPSDADAIASLTAAHNDAVSFHAWLQWIAEEQLEAAAKTAKTAGMEIGLLADLAVGASPDGSEMWAGSAHFLHDVSIGAPPDLLAPQGQEWGLRTLSPFAMEQDGMAGFRALVSAVMRHCGGIRIDHVFQLRRLFLVPVGRPASEGAYLRYPTEAMLAVLRVESHRAQCMVIGEDLGTKPPDFTQTLLSSGILGYRVLYFERSSEGDFLPPDAYDAETMAVIDTHDLATFRGWWRGEDISERLQYGVIDADRSEHAIAERSDDRRRLIGLLRQQGLVESDDLPDEAPTEAVVRLLARCRSMLVGLSLDDVLGEIGQQNVPGVTEGPPNWRRRLPLTVAELGAEGGPLDSFARAMAAEGRGKPRIPETRTL
jgi:(1->4)-alpha-D-glucan 1-alpha-D-glucosylmutase